MGINFVLQLCTERQRRIQQWNRFSSAWGLGVVSECIFSINGINLLEPGSPISLSPWD